jgi:thioesterase domain-containing protein/NAD(P)-dependent dehydrogenase (short-subunit alcohol dehydrogenase family)/acyl carrier protein
MIDPGETVDFPALFAQGFPDRILWTAPLAGRADFGPAFHLVQALQLADPADPPRLTFVAQAGAGGAPPPAAALLTGITRVAPREIPGLLAALVETDGADAAAARAILAEGDSGARDDHVRLQGGKRLVPVLRPAGDGGGGTRIRQGGTYLILGGTGGIGRALAGWLAREFGAKVALIARGSPDNERRISALLRDAGSGTIRFFPADATDPASLDSALARVRDAFGPVQGAFHAAGAIADAPMAAKTADDVAAVLAPKVDGAVNLSALLPAGTLDFFAVFSSSSVVIAPPGQVDYVAANAFLEALAASRPDGLVLAWGAWADTGMAAQTYGQEDSGDGPHPLLGRPDKGPDGSLTFQRWFDPRALWVLQDHVVGGVKILPGTAYLEMARAAAQAAAPDSTLELTGLTLALPMAFPADEPRLVRLTLHPDATGYGLRIESGRGGGTELLDHASGRLERRHRPDLSIPANLRRKESFLPLPQREHPLQGEMIDFGPRWDCLGPIRAAGKVAECLLRLPESFAADLGTWAFHPGLSDMAVTIGLHLLEELRGTPHGIYAPVSFARVRFLAALTPDVLARALLKAHEPRRMARYDVVLKDRQGNPLVIIEDIELRYVAGGSFVLPEEAAQGVTERMLALGIREREAPAVFTRALAGTDRHLLISAVAPAALRRAFAEAPRPRKSRTAREGEAGSAGRSPVEAKLAEFWADLLGTDDIASSDDFFDLGGHSLSAVRLFSRIRKEWGADLPLSALFQAPTLGQLAELVRAEAGLPEAPGEAAPAPVAAETGRWSPLVRIKQGGTETVPLFCVHGAGGNVLNFRSLAGYLRPGQRFFGLQAQGTDGVLPPHDTIEEMADCYLAAIRAEQPEGPYVLAGYSGGGVVAYEMAQCLRADGQEVAALIMFDSLAPHVTRKKMSRLEKLWAIRHWSLKFALDWPRRRRKAKDDKAKSAEIRAMLRRGETLPREYLGRRMQDAYHLAQTRYDARAYDGRIVLFTAGRAGTEFLRAGPKLGWADLVRGGIDLHRYDCDHFNMMADPTIGEIAETLNDILIAAGRSRAG